MEHYFAEQEIEDSYCSFLVKKKQFTIIVTFLKNKLKRDEVTELDLIQTRTSELLSLEGVGRASIEALQSYFIDTLLHNFYVLKEGGVNFKLLNGSLYNYDKQLSERIKFFNRKSIEELCDFESRTLKLPHKGALKGSAMVISISWNEIMDIYDGKITKIGSNYIVTYSDDKDITVSKSDLDSLLDKWRM